MTTPPKSSDDFRRMSTWYFRVFVVVLSLFVIGVAALGWWFGGWWGLAGGAAISAAIFVGGLIGGTLMWAMTQDGG